MIYFNMVSYHGKRYPSSIPLHLEEIAGHFDVKALCPKLPYSLHTEYSYGARAFSSPLLYKYPELVWANRNGIPQLWKNKIWAKSFAQFILDFTSGLPAPKVIEIHPPFNDYVGSVKEFIDIYMVFEDIIKSRYSKTDIHLENRCGSRYSDGLFLISTLPQIKELCGYIAGANLSLRIALDIPQLYTAHQVSPKRHSGITALLNESHEIRPYIGGVHIWGKALSKNRRLAHVGDLNSYFNNNMVFKKEFLHALSQLFDDDHVRNLVLEVNSQNEDLLSIINDLNSAGFTYL